MLHIFITNRFDDHGGRLHRAARHRLRGADRGRGHGRTSAWGNRAAGRAGADRLPLSLGPATEEIRVKAGWNLTGDSFWQDEEGRFHFAARSDDMIISAGYNIAGPEVEAALFSHPAVLECAVIGAMDEERGQWWRRMSCWRRAMRRTLCW